MSKPIILITAGKQNRQAPWGQRQLTYTGCGLDYVDSVIRAGGAPVLLPRHGDTDSIRAAASIAHGVIFTGGGDVVSLNYGEEPHRTAKWTDPVRDDMEIALARIATDMGLPVLGICRGIQILNVAAGGTLVQDVPSQVPGAIQHYANPLDPIAAHSIDIEPDSLLARLLGSTASRVNSYHHQAVKEAGKGLRIVARGRDGVAEAVEATDNRRLLAVQWHPEELSGADACCLALFEWIVNEATRFQELRLLSSAPEPDETVEEPPIIRIANAILSEAIRQGATEVRVEAAKKGVKIIHTTPAGDSRETMTFPVHLRGVLFDRFLRMADVDLGGSGPIHEGEIRIQHDGESYVFRASYEPGPDGEKLTLNLLSS
jgi:gamma-glutamyl-gamma-aminobutyrate hydrolase PuuD